MLERLGTPGHEMISAPDKTVLSLLERHLASNPDTVYFEVGVGIGATALEVARLMRNRGAMHLFSRARDVAELKRDLEALGFTNVHGDWGSPANRFSGYHFELAYAHLRGALPHFDLAYLDGGHLFHLDAPAACVLKELCKPGGHVIFDDWSWSLERSVGMNPKVCPSTAVDFDPRQIAECHVQMVCRIVMDTDPRFRLVGIESDSAIYERVG